MFQSDRILTWSPREIDYFSVDLYYKTLRDRILEANLKHGRYTKDKQAVQRKSGEVGRKINASVKLIKQKSADAELYWRFT